MKNLGLVTFLLGISIFLFAAFLGKHVWNPALIDRLYVEDEVKEMLRASFQDLEGFETSNPFRFKGEITTRIDEINTSQLGRYGFTEDDLSSIVGANPDLVFKLSSVDSAIRPGPGSEFKVSSFKAYSSWLEGRKFGDAEDMRRVLQGVAMDIEQYEIKSKKGIDRYKRKDIVYDLIRGSNAGVVVTEPWLFIFLTYGLSILGGLLFFWPDLRLLPGIKNNGVFTSPATNGGWIGILAGSLLIAFYVLLYFYPEFMTNWIRMVDPVSKMLNGGEAGRFFLYGFMYTLTILVMGVRMLIKYRANRYQQVRTVSVMFFQTAFAFLIPEILIRLNKPYFDFKNIWPLDYDFFFDSELTKLVEAGSLGFFMLGWGTALVVIGVPVMVYFFGKRWYCSWVCGCGGLAETLGDPYRQLSNKSVSAWKVERWMVHAVLAFSIIMTVGVLYTYWTGSGQLLGLNTYSIREWYGFGIGAVFAGVVGTGFYPFMGNRVWCRFGCPLAAYLGLVQRFKSRFRITTNGGQCISCGNCSTYCEMGIDVRWYAQRGQNIVRSSCVGCGICSAVCPRGVLKLENLSSERFQKSAFTGNKGVTTPL